MENYLSWKKSYMKPGSHPNYERWVKRFRKFVGKDDHYTLEDVSRFRDFLKEVPYSPKNIQYGLYLVRDYINYLNSVQGLDFPLHLFRIRQERSKSHYPVTTGEYEKMIDTLTEHEPVPLQRLIMLRILFETGIRGGELLSIRMSDLAEQGATIRNEKNHRNRIIAWSTETNRLVKFYLPLREQIQCPEDWLFVSFKYKPVRKLTTRQLERIVIEIRKKAGIESLIRPHSFRHGFVHRKLCLGTPITTIAQMLGHSSTMNVMNYAQLTSKEIKQAWGIEKGEMY